MEIEKEELKEAMNKIINENNELIVDFADKMEKNIEIFVVWLRI